MFTRAERVARIQAEEGNLFADSQAHLFAGEFSREEYLLALDAPAFLRLRRRTRVLTRYLDDCVWAAVGAGCNQVVAVGGAFDGRVLRLPGLGAAGAKYFELDRPEHHALREKRLAAAGASLPEFAVPVSAPVSAKDFEGACGDALAAAGFDPGAGAVFVLQDLPSVVFEGTSKRWLGWLAKSRQPPTRLLLAAEESEIGCIDAQLALLASGFRDVETPTYEEVCATYLPADPPEASERLTLAIAQL